MKKLIKNIKYLMMLSIVTLLNQNVANANDVGDPTKIGEVFEKVKPDIIEIVKPVSAVLIFVAVICLGINIIIKRNNPQERTGLLWGLGMCAIGSFILGSAGIIYAFIMTGIAS